MKEVFISIRKFKLGDVIVFNELSLKATEISKNGVWFISSRNNREFQAYRYLDTLTKKYVENGWTFRKGEARFISCFDRELDLL